MRDDDVIGAVLGNLNFSHKMFETKHAPDIFRSFSWPSIGVELITCN